MNSNGVPDWAKLILREPETLARLEWYEDEVVSERGSSYAIRDGIPIFYNKADSYMNRQTWPVVDRRNPTVRAFEDRTTIFDRLSDQLRGKTVIDVCSGGGMPGYYLASRYDCRVISIEIAFNAIKYYGDGFRHYYGVSDQQVVRVCGDGLYLPISSNAVDAVLGTSWIHHFSDKAAVLRGALRVLKPGGLLIAHNEILSSFMSKPTSDEDLFTTWGKYRKAALDAGFDKVKVVPVHPLHYFTRWIRGSVDIIGIRPS